ncbi:glucosaminidase domain-containing protein [Clostridium paraputrificum]|uniref:glucosaminidase domain-containing protein n=1 Tax=Clostridium paraputrificum TaxID=29363 RepID=UPI003D34A744
MKKKVISTVVLISLLLPQIYVSATDDKYEKVITKETILVSEEESNNIRVKARMSTFKPEEFKEVTKEYETLVKKTSANYEIAIAKSDMSYIYADRADSYKEAVEKADKLRKENSDYGITPAVINNEGVVTYATESIGRLWRYYTNEEAKKETNSFFYSDPELKNAYTYINDGYMSEAPIVEERENEAKVLISGYKGWLNRKIDRYGTTSSRDLIIVPMSQVKNPSYYFVEDGILYHFIITSMDNPGATQSTTMVGVAPSYLEKGKKYSSYDGKYFYEGTDIRDGLTILTRDLKSGTNKSAVNPNDPYYSYYKYLPFRTKTNYTASEIDKFILEAIDRLIAEDKNNKHYERSKLKGIGKTIIDAQNRYGVNGLLMLGVAINESDWGVSANAQDKNNLFGLNAQDNRPGDASKFTSIEDCVTDFAKNYISRGYADPSNFTYYGGFLGDKALGANVKYAADPYWSDKAVHYAFLADYRMAGNNISKMKDYNYYQLGMYTGTTPVTDISGSTLYQVATAPKTNNSSHIGSVVALLYGSTELVNGTSCYEFYSERTTPVTDGRFNGEYDWSKLGYAKADSIKFINTGETRIEKEDLDRNKIIDTKDLAILASSYNISKGQSGWNEKQDFNRDGIVDIYDIVRLSKKLKA